MTNCDSFYAPDAGTWRRWLEKNATKSAGVWLLFAKKHTHRPCVSYQEALDEALCRGWIDGVIKRIDEGSYARRFSPRTNSANWSVKNLARMRDLLAEGRVTQAGLAVLGVPLEPQAAPERFEPPSETPVFVTEAITRSPKAASFWETLAPGYRKRYLGWITSAKKDEVRQTRLARVIGFLEEGKKSVLV